MTREPDSNPQMEMTVRQRDHQQCQNCLRHASEVDELVVTRIISPEYGGTDRLGNYITLCQRCASGLKKSRN